jgi:hypothetical protein
VPRAPTARTVELVGSPSGIVRSADDPFHVACHRRAQRLRRHDDARAARARRRRRAQPGTSLAEAAIMMTPSRSPALAISLLLLGGLAACPAPPPRSADRAPSPGLDQLVIAARARMHTRFAAAQGIQLAIGMDDLDRARGDARRIASLDEPGILPAWRPYVDDIRAAADQVAATTDTAPAGRAMARLGRACALCHEATGATITFPRVPAPPADGKLGPQMASHEWAAARMWEGVIGPDDDRWLAGARTLAVAPLAITAESGALGIADDVAETRLLAERAMKTGDHDARATLYGDLLATCARCHAAIRR